MVSQSKVEEHARRMEAYVYQFGLRVQQGTESMIQEISSHIMAELSLKKGLIRQTPENAAKVLEVELVFQRELSKSGFYVEVMALVHGFVDQVDEFRTLYDEMGNLPEMELNEDDREILANQAAAAIAVIEGHASKVSVNLRHFLARSLGDITQSTLVSGVINVVRKVNQVEPIAKDQMILWFRLLAHLSYRHAEELGYNLKYRYVGPYDEKSRDFCDKLLRSSSFRRDEIASLDNGQVADAFVNGGGYNCKHFWVAEPMA